MKFMKKKKKYQDKQSRSGLSGHQAEYRERHRDRNLLLDPDGCQEKDRKDPDHLFKELGGCRDRHFFLSVVVAADTGMDGSAGDCKGHDGEQRGAPRFHEDRSREKSGKMSDHKGRGE